MNLKPTITKEEIAKMPRAAFEGDIVVVEDAQGLNDAIGQLSQCTEIGFDTETRPNFTKRKHYKMSLMQLSANDVCFLIRLNKLGGMPHVLERFLKSRKVCKVGISLHDDFNGLHSLTDVAPQNCIDLQKYVPGFGIEDMSLQKIYAIVFGKKISKRMRLSNWEADVLTEAQQQYAALDAWACLHIYQHLNTLK